MTNEDCIFCKIVRGDFPSWKVFESASHIAFLTPFPNTPGFTVVIPKAHETGAILSMDEEKYLDLMMAARNVAHTLERALNCKRVGLIAEGMGVDHAHVKLIPMHGIPDGPWKPILSKEPRFTEIYQGYLTTHDGPRMPDAELTRVQNLILSA
ncbi:MAG: HIT family protein [Bacteroidota bacterium]|nr:HIT family protein [Bacteroidota bacterium]MDP4287823.1 HIT family protein [Bacteroidota bacterium]